MFKFTKCMSCKKYFLLENSPWCACKIYPELIPEEIYQNEFDSNKPINCDEYEFNPEWDD